MSLSIPFLKKLKKLCENSFEKAGSSERKNNSCYHINNSCNILSDVL